MIVSVANVKIDKNAYHSKDVLTRNANDFLKDRSKQIITMNTLEPKRELKKVKMKWLIWTEKMIFLKKMEKNMKIGNELVYK